MTAAPILRVAIYDELMDLSDDPIPADAAPYADLPDAYELSRPTFRAIYTYSPEEVAHVSVWSPGVRSATVNDKPASADEPRTLTMPPMVLFSATRIAFLCSPSAG